MFYSAAVNVRADIYKGKMEIIVNGVKKEVNAGLSVEGYLQDLEINLDTVVVECDSTILQRDEYSGHILKEGAVLELIRFIGGG